MLNDKWLLFSALPSNILHQYIDIFLSLQHYVNLYRQSRMRSIWHAITPKHFTWLYYYSF